jgi:GT2 family glycosyltransferase
MFFAEDELCWRLRKAGWKIYHLGDTFVYHIGSFSMGKLNSGFLGTLSLKDRLECHAIVLGPIRAQIFRSIYRMDSIMTAILKLCNVIQ